MALQDTVFASTHPLLEEILFVNVYRKASGCNSRYQLYSLDPKRLPTETRNEYEFVP